MTAVDMEVAEASEAIGITRSAAAGEAVVEAVDGATSNDSPEMKYLSLWTSGIEEKITRDTTSWRDTGLIAEDLFGHNQRWSTFSPGPQILPLRFVIDA